MGCEFIGISGYRTGDVEDAKTIRSRFAFDLTNLDLRGRVVVSATLPLMHEVGAEPTATIRLSDPSARSAYGHLDNAPSGRATWIWVPLTADAIADLEQASGGFFSLDAVLEDLEGHPQRLGNTGAPSLLLVGVADLAERSSVAA